MNDHKLIAKRLDNLTDLNLVAEAFPGLVLALGAKDEATANRILGELLARVTDPDMVADSLLMTVHQNHVSALVHALSAVQLTLFPLEDGVLK